MSAINLSRRLVLGLVSAIALGSVSLPVLAQERPDLVVGVADIPPTLEPGKELSNVGTRVNYSIFDTLIRRDFEDAFQQVDAILSPVVPAPARRIGAVSADPLQEYLSDIFTLAANLAGIPGISVPCGTTDWDGGKNLPTGLQILAPHLAEAKLLRIAKAAEQD